MKIFGRTGSALVASISILAAARASAAGSEVRAMWVCRWDYRSESDVREVVRNCARLGLNRIYFQVRGRADAFYRSRFEPWGEELGGADPGFDPLGVAIEEASRNGLELHAWVNVLAGWKGGALPRDRRHIVHRHRDWFLFDRQGRRPVTGEHYALINPCLPEVRSYLAEVIGDIARRYRVAGVHLDYVRFTAEGAAARQAVPYDPATLSRFRKLTGGFPTRHPERWDAFRRDSVSEVVRQIAAAVRSARPACKLSAAVLRDLARGRREFFQDARRWLEQRWIDEVLPMNYDRGAEGFARALDAAIGEAGKRRLICGVGAFLIDEPRVLARQIEAARARGSLGYSLFSYSSFFASPAPGAEQGPRAERRRAALRAEITKLHRRGAAAAASHAPSATSGRLPRHSFSSRAW